MARLRLEEFDPGGGAEPAADPAAPALSAAEEAKLAGYEQGYQAGWDDAVAAQTENQSNLKSDLARNLQALSFTWQEVRAHMLTALEPLLTGMVDRLLPETARESLAPVVLEQLMPLAEQALDQPAVLVLNPAVREPVEALLREATGLPLRIEEEPTLAEGQVYLRFGPAEAKVDLTRAIAEITAAVRGFFTLHRSVGPMDDLTETNPFAQVPIEITISVGRARPAVKDLLRLSRDAILPLDRRVDDPVELYIGDRLIARGELTEVEGDPAGQLAVRVTEVASMKDGL